MVHSGQSAWNRTKLVLGSASAQILSKMELFTEKETRFVEAHQVKGRAPVSVEPLEDKSSNS